VVAAVALVPRWNLARLTNGANVYFDAQPTPDRILFVREDVHGGVTTVTERQGVRSLYTNGKFQGNTGWEMKAQRMFCHYPSLFIDSFERALVIGLGTGTTLGAFAAYPWQRIDLVEISPAIAEAAKLYFSGPNRGALLDPRVRLTLGDGRNYLLVSDTRYDLIGMELSSIWFAGASSLYSREYYALVRRHLREHGVFQQWVQLHHIYERDFATILHTLRSEFAHVALFYGGRQGILVASQQPLRASLEHIEARAMIPTVRETVPEGRQLPDLVDDVLVFDAALDRYIEQAAHRAGVQVSDLVATDDSLYLEYATPRGNVLPWSSQEGLVDHIKPHRDDGAIRSLLVP
jgi:spermidine synthase